MRVGIVGLGFMGSVHLRNWQALGAGVRVVAVCDRHPVPGSGKAGNLGGEVEMDLSDVAVYSDMGEMLAKERLDAVSIALPTHLHRAASIRALEAGVHVLCEKPMALSLADCDAMIAAAKQADKILMVAHCIRFWPEYVWLKRAVESGEYGNWRSADFSRLSFVPSWAKGSWFSDPEKSGGAALDLHVHDVDFIRWALGDPQELHSSGGVDFVRTAFDFGAGRAVSATASWRMPESFGFEMAFEVLFERALVRFSSRSEPPLTVYPHDGEPSSPAPSSSDGYAGEIRHFARLISGEEREAVVPPEDARESLGLALRIRDALGGEA